MTTKIKEIGNRINIYLMTLSGLALIISGIVTHDRDPMVLHIVLGVVFTCACIRHIIPRRKAFKKYITGK